MSAAHILGIAFAILALVPAGFSWLGGPFNVAVVGRGESAKGLGGLLLGFWSQPEN